MKKQILVKSEWFKDIWDLPIETQDKIVSDVIRLQLGEEKEYKDDIIIVALVDYIRRKI